MDVDESIPEPSESIPELDESIPEPDESILDLPTSRSIPELDESIPEFLESTENDNRRPVDGMKRLHRFLILGSETPTYCIARPRLVREDARAILDLLQEGRGVDVVNEILRFSTQGRTVKQFPIMFALAICARNGDLLTKRRAYEVLPQVCRIPTHLFMFVSYCKEFCIKYQSTTGWGRAHRNAMKKWYISQASDPMKLAMDITKYQTRKGWSHKDVARLTHLKPDAANVPDGLPTIMMYIARGWNEVNRYYFPENGIQTDRNEMTDAVLGFLKAVEDVKVLIGDDHQQQVANLILTHNLVREHIPAVSLDSIEVWRALAKKMPMTAMIRNLGKMTSIGLLAGGSPETMNVCDKLQDQNLLRHARIHPFKVLVALKTYKDGHGDKGKLTWTPNEEIVNALDNAFYCSFKLVESTKKRYFLAFDVSGLMSNLGCVGTPCITPRVAAAAMSMVVAKTETETVSHFVAFSNVVSPLTIDENTSLVDVLALMGQVPVGRLTECARPMIYATENDLDVDVFVVYTDCKTKLGDIHPSEALQQYREHSGITDAKLIVVAMRPNDFTIAVPDDPWMFDMAGFDSHAPDVMREFILGTI